jgi:nicotinamide-nucleotide amidase
MGYGLLELAQRSGAALRTHGWTIATAESCTGGLLGHMLTEVAGSSAYYVGSIIAYSNDIKRDMLHVPPAILETDGAVSEATARTMAESVRERMRCDVSIATTGIAGPGGGSDTKPVGLVYIAVALPTTTYCQRYLFSGDRSANKKESAVAAFQLLLQML